MAFLLEVGLQSEEDAMTELWGKTLRARSGQDVRVSVMDHMGMKGIFLSPSILLIGLTPNQASDLAAELLEAVRQEANRK